MTKVYVAGKEVERGKRIGAMVERNGCRVAWPWWQDFDGTNIKPLGTPQIELQAVKDSDILIYLYEDDQLSAHYELGMALGLGKPVIAVREHSEWFLGLDNVTVIPDDSKIEEELQKRIVRLGSAD